jgi:hypothetical protein
MVQAPFYQAGGLSYLGRSHHTPPTFYAVFEQVQACAAHRAVRARPRRIGETDFPSTGSLIICGWSVGTKYLRNGEGPPQKGESLAGFSGLVAKRSLPGPRQALKFSTSKPLVGGALLSLTAPTFVLNHSVLNSCIPALFGSLVRFRGDWRGRTSGPVSACRARKFAPSAPVQHL